MESRRLVVWISAGILGFQGVTLALNLVNCTVLSWLWVYRHGLESVAVPQGSPNAGLPAPDPPEEEGSIGSGLPGLPREGKKRPGPDSGGLRWMPFTRCVVPPGCSG